MLSASRTSSEMGLVRNHPTAESDDVVSHGNRHLVKEGPAQLTAVSGAGLAEFDSMKAPALR